MGKLDEFSEAMAAYFSSPAPQDSWLRDYIVDPSAKPRFDLCESEGMTFTTAIPPGQAMSLSPWQVDALSYPEFSSVQIAREPVFAGTKVVETTLAVERYEDWSAVRSPARAARRRQRGFPQRIVDRERPCAFEIGGVLYIHPNLYRDTLAQIGTDFKQHMDRNILRAMLSKNGNDR